MKALLIDDETDDAVSESEEDLTARTRLTYSVFSEETISSEHGKYIAYGIAVSDEQGRLLRAVHDITCDRSALESLATLCNQLSLSLCHLDDVIEDFLG